MCLFSELFWSVCSRIWNEYGESCITLYSVQMRENTDQNNSQFEHAVHVLRYSRRSLLYVPEQPRLVILLEITNDLFQSQMFHAFQIL